MTEIDVDKDKAFKAIKDSMPQSLMIPTKSSKKQSKSWIDKPDLIQIQKRERKTRMTR